MLSVLSVKCILNPFLIIVASSEVKDPFIKRFKSFSELQKYAKAAPDIELLSKIKVRATAVCVFSP